MKFWCTVVAVIGAVGRGQLSKFALVGDGRSGRSQQPSWPAKHALNLKEPFITFSTAGIAGRRFSRTTRTGGAFCKHSGRLARGPAGASMPLCCLRPEPAEWDEQPLPFHDRNSAAESGGGDALVSDDVDDALQPASPSLRASFSRAIQGCSPST